MMLMWCITKEKDITTDKTKVNGCKTKRSIFYIGTLVQGQSVYIWTAARPLYVKECDLFLKTSLQGVPGYKGEFVLRGLPN